jgi:hypothetical protein
VRDGKFDSYMGSLMVTISDVLLFMLLGEYDMAKHKAKKKSQKKIEKVMHEFKEGELKSGSKKGPIVTNPKQAIAIAISESKKKKK